MADQFVPLSTRTRGLATVCVNLGDSLCGCPNTDRSTRGPLSGASLMSWCFQARFALKPITPPRAVDCLATRALGRLDGAYGASVRSVLEKFGSQLLSSG